MKNKKHNDELHEIYLEYGDEVNNILKRPEIIRVEDYAKSVRLKKLGVKYAIYVKTEKEGKTILNRIKESTNRYNKKRKDYYDREGVSYKPYKPRIRIICINNQKIVLSKTPAHRSFVFSGKGLKELVDSNYEFKITYCEEEEKEYIEKQYNDFNSWSKKNIDDKKRYTIHLYSGDAYRITYYDECKNKRIQINMGNYLIIAGKNNSIADANKRKKRSDILEEMYRIFGVSIMKK